MCSDDPFLAAAASIGRRIVAEAVWHDGVCSWVGAVADPERPWRPEYRALESNVYEGTAGVGLFLAQLASVTGDAPARTTAVGAIRHAVERAHQLPPERRDGFHAGSLGVAWAALRAGELLDVEEPVDRGRELALVARPTLTLERCPDLVLGSAGALIALLALADRFDDAAMLEEALATGEQLLACATVTRHGSSWATEGRRYRHHLCGLSHGAAGIGLALLELYAATGEPRFRSGATGAFAYERSWLDATSHSWPDLRLAGQRRGAARRIAPTAGTWCHGEAGIALARLRAVELLDDEDCLADAEIALEATSRALARTLPYGIDDLTLCHGASGAAEVLLCAADALAQWAEPATELGQVALERHLGKEDWPCGIAGGTSPGLFRGLSGIGCWFLRLHDRGLPSPLQLPKLRLTGTLRRA